MGLEIGLETGLRLRLGIVFAMAYGVHVHFSGQTGQGVKLKKKRKKNGVRARCRDELPPCSVEHVFKTALSLQIAYIFGLIYIQQCFGTFQSSVWQILIFSQI